MALEIQLLGAPCVRRGGVAVPAPRGHKVWGLLAYLLCGSGPTCRAHLASQLFEDAEDPLAALRWNLSELRRLLGSEGLRGDTPQLDLPAGAIVDVQMLSGPASARVLALPGLGRELLEGMHFAGHPSFCAWLDAQRRRCSANAAAVLREAVLLRLASGDTADAVAVAYRLVALDPLIESSQALLVRSLAAAGDGIAAARQVAACTQLFRRELGVLPGAALAAAAATTTAHAIRQAVGGRAGVQAQLDAGVAAVRAGAQEAGLECLRRAMADADALGDVRLRSRARLALGSALVHVARGRDEEGVLALHEVLALAEPGGLPEAGTACRELGYVEFLRGDYTRADLWVHRARELARTDPGEQAALDVLQGAALSDTAQYPRALRLLAQAVTRSADLHDDRQHAYALSMLGRVHLLCGELKLARETLDRSISLADASWTAFSPWPQSLRAEIDLEQDQVQAAEERFENAFALGCQLGDPCWEAMAGRGLGRVAAARRQPLRAVQLLKDAIARSARLPDAYQWGRAYAIDALCTVTVREGLPEAAHWVDQLLVLAARAGMREMVARAHLHGAALGRAGSATAAHVLCTEIGNPMLARLDTQNT